MEKEFLYVGHYIDIDGNYVLKIGTTNDLDRRAKEHTRNYRRAKTNTLPTESQFEYDWWLPLSKYNTLRYEDRNRAKWQEENFGVFVRNDRFVCAEKPAEVSVTVRRTYCIALQGGAFLIGLLDKKSNIFGLLAGVPQRAEFAICISCTIFQSKFCANFHLVFFPKLCYNNIVIKKGKR